MQPVRVLQGEVPYVVLKPCTSHRVLFNAYGVKDGMFYPTKANIHALCTCLNQFQAGTITGCDTVDPKFPADTPPKQIAAITEKRLAELGRSYQCNILGAVFIALLESYGFAFEKSVARASVSVEDREFFEVVYPIFKGYFDTPQTAAADLLPYLDDVVRNNTGVYTILAVRSMPVQILVGLRQISYLKRLYRYAVVSMIPYPPEKVHDNLVHSPETMEELALHAKLFRERRVK